MNTPPYAAYVRERCRLQRGDCAVKHEYRRAEYGEPGRALLAQREPHEVAAADFAQARQGERADGKRDAREVRIPDRKRVFSQLWVAGVSYEFSMIAATPGTPRKSPTCRSTWERSACGSLCAACRSSSARRACGSSPETCVRS